VKLQTLQALTYKSVKNVWGPLITFIGGGFAAEAAKIFLTKSEGQTEVKKRGSITNRSITIEYSNDKLKMNTFSVIILALLFFIISVCNNINIRTRMIGKAVGP
jgi:hypothetical protein